MKVQRQMSIYVHISISKKSDTVIGQVLVKKPHSLCWLLLMSEELSVTFYFFLRIQSTFEM